MPSMKNETQVLLADLNARIQRIVEIARQEGHERALTEIRALVGGGGTPIRRGPGRPPKSAAFTADADAAPMRRKKRKNPWANMTSEERAVRVRKMQAGRGLVPKADR